MKLEVVYEDFIPNIKVNAIIIAFDEKELKIKYSNLIEEKENDYEFK